jgi:predicted 2-oxoglutarate/Fe(II)-dependent dioxygenase YbiX
VVILAGPAPAAAALAVAAAFRARAADFETLGADVLLVVDGEGPDAATYQAVRDDIPRIVFCLPEYFQRCGCHEGRPWAFVMDRNLRVFAQVDPRDPERATAFALSHLAGLPTETARDIAMPAPVLSVPHIFSPAFCRALIDHFEKSPHAPGGMASIDAAGNAIHKIDAGKKHREDCVLSPGEPIRDQVVGALSRACLPEMMKAFQFDATFMDRVLIARYDDTGGYFRRHRDNVAAAVSFRQFAISVNLNTEDYEGGYLLFPEYNGHRYRPATGAGIIFSASLLHEATPIVKGRRYVLLTFFHNAEAEARRLATLRKAEPVAA